ncbi:MAG: 50S ribosomal protein L19 [Bacteroidetes bacterium HGW-Bacteroidetes-6]|jgi:large subunit ribosomal protein L19|nr:MAG: 50S ribosomal protein L19 [Bacteroidetes bacterium HGW-Bacteroidetes-6]
MNKGELIRYAEEQLVATKQFPVFKAGDTVTIKYKITEGNKERLQAFQGIVLQISGKGVNKTFTVRKISNNIGVERIFPVSSPFVEAVEVNKRGVVRRSRIFYLRQLRGKKARIKEKKY